MKIPANDFVFAGKIGERSKGLNVKEAFGQM
jgi:hypothetical protein